MSTCVNGFKSHSATLCLWLWWCRWLISMAFVSFCVVVMCINLAGLAALLQCSNYVTGMSVCTFLYDCDCPYVSVCPSICLSVLSVSVFLPSCLVVNHIHSSFALVLCQAYFVSHFCLGYLLSVLCLRVLSLMSSQMFFDPFFTWEHSLIYQINTDDSAVYYFMEIAVVVITRLIFFFSLCCHLH